MIGKTNAISGVSAPVPIIKTVSGSVISISDALERPAESLVVGIEPVQSGSGDPSPSNIRPISGWSNVKVYRESQYDAGATPYATINLNGTVYGGSLDVTTGVLTVDRAFYEYDGDEDEAWFAGTNYYGLGSQQHSIGNNDLTQIANWLVGGGNNYTQYGNFRAQANGAVVVGNNDGGSPHWADVTAFKSALAQNPLQVCYKLDTPQTVQLSPTTVQMLLGNNTMWSDSGDSELQYWARR